MIAYLICFNKIKLALLKKNNFTYIPVTRKNKIIINLLIKYNVVLGFKKIKHNFNFFYKVLLNNKIPFFNIKNILKITKPRHVKIHDLLKLNNKNTKTVYILSTSKGFLNIGEAINLKQGGFLVFRIN